MDTTLSPKRSRRTQTTKPVDIIQNTKIGPFTSELVATSLFLDPIEGVYCGSRINVSALLKFITLSCGRDETMDISLPKDDCISEKHFSLKMTKLSKGTKLSIRDDNSTNGTKLNGVRISATRYWYIYKLTSSMLFLSSFIPDDMNCRWSSLDPGDVIGIGDSKFKLLQI
jgi:pSer/pThr/pTyr-binding forkhead associated (FHA) protein